MGFYTRSEHEAMRKDLASSAFQALLRQLPLDEDQALVEISELTEVDVGGVILWKLTGVPDPHVKRVVRYARENNLPFYSYQIKPTKKVIKNWLDYFYGLDRHAVKSRFQFKFWELAFSDPRRDLE